MTGNFEIFDEALSLIDKKEYKKTFFLMRNNFDKSHFKDEDIISYLKGNISLFWTQDNGSSFFEIVDKKNNFIHSRYLQELDYYNDLIFINDEYFEVKGNTDLEFFECIIPNHNLKDNIVSLTKKLNGKISNSKGQYCLKKENKILWLSKVKVDTFFCSKMI